MKESFKSPEQLQKQVEQVKERVGAEILPESAQQLPPEESVREYPARYKHFVEILRAIKNPEANTATSDKAVKYFKILSNLQEYLFNAEGPEGDKTLLPRQLETLGKISTFLERGYTEGNVKMPTGIGKTVIFSKFIEAATKSNAARVLVVGPTKIILKQNRWKLDAFSEVEAGAYYGDEKKDTTKGVTLTTYSSLRNGIKNGDINPKDYDVLILDEAHRALGEETTAAVESFPEHVIKLGFTATPEFHEEKTVADILPVTIDSMSVREGIKTGLLAGLKVFMVPTKKDASSLERKGKDYQEEALSKIINTPDRNKLIVDVYTQNKIFNGKRAVAYCGGVTHAKDLVNSFLTSGVAAAYIDGATEETEREDILAKFKAGTITVLCNAEVLIEGFDEPEAEICINAAPTMSRVVAEQRGGRVLRRSKVKNNKVGYIIEITDEFGESENTPVLFSEIAGAAEIMPEKNDATKDGTDTERNTKERVRRKQTDVQVTNDVIDDPELVMQLTNNNSKQRFERMFDFAPAGWTYPTRLAHELNVKEVKIRSFAETQKAGNPEWLKKYLTVTDILTTHYHPELVHRIRKNFNPKLFDTMTAKEYAEKYVTTEARAAELLEASNVSAKQKAHRYEEGVYYPTRESESIISAEAKHEHEVEQSVDENADARYWEEDDRSEEEKEQEYWDSFNEITGGEDGEDTEIEAGPDSVPFKEEVHQALSTDGLEGLTEEQIRQIHMVLETLPKRIQRVIHERFFANRTLEDIATEFKVTRERIRGIEAKGLRMLRHPSRARVLESILEGDEANQDDMRDMRQKADINSAEAIPTRDLARKFISFRNQYAKLSKDDTLVAPGQKKYLEQFGILLNSLVQRDREVLEKNVDDIAEKGYSTYTRDRQKARDLLASRAFRLVLGESSLVDTHVIFSPDKKMAQLYQPSDIESEIQYLQYEVENASKEMEELQTTLNSGDLRKRARELIERKIQVRTERRNDAWNRLNELLNYRQRYQQHFKILKRQA
ncbi:MAG: DEAD/DEAH box helicase family protein [bacterium]|nr:DEAD/DEAH box helicase family protein [bacterium]